MTKMCFATTEAPTAIGPYSQAVGANNLLFISGQLPIDPTTGTMIEGTISEKTDRILQNIGAIAKEAGAELSQVVKTTVFLTDLSDFQDMNSMYEKFFPTNPPARSTVQVAALPLDSNIEIECILAL